MKVEIANDKMLSYWGKGKELIGQPLTTAVPELIGQPFLQILDEVFTTGIIHEGKNEVAQLLVNGVLGTHYFNYTYKPICNDAGEVYGIINMAVDVTDQVLARTKIEESEKQFRQMAELLPQKIWTSDAVGNKNYFNQTLLDYAGSSLEELKGTGWQKIIHPDDWEKNKDQWEECISTGKNYETENRLLRKDGKYLWHLTLAVAIKDESGKIKTWVGSKTEIQKMKEEEQRRSDFIKMVSHELKTPVTSIKGYVQMLMMIFKEENVALFPVQIENSLVRIDHLVSRLTRLITEMLDLSRIETDRMELKNELFNLNHLIKDAIDDICLTHPKHHINIYPEFDCNIYGDRGRIEQVIINIVINAIKYSADSNIIEVFIRQAENNMVAVSIKDYGIGIDIAEHKKIFERFYRVDGKVEETYAGFGIGLYLASEIIERHNGTITLESEKGQGSVFKFTLPVVTETKS